MNREQLVEAEIFKIESAHHFHGATCLCGFSSARSRSRTEHITGLVRAVFEQAHTPTGDEPVAYGIYGRVTGNLKYVQVMDEQEAAEQSEFYDVVPLFRRTAQGEPTLTESQARAVTTAHAIAQSTGMTVSQVVETVNSVRRHAEKRAEGEAERGEVEWEFSWSGTDDEGDDWVMDDTFDTRDSAEAYTRRPIGRWVFTDNGELVRRRKAGPWELVNENGSER